MSAPRRTAAPLGYEPIETALHLLDMGEPSRWAAARLQAVDNPAAQEAVRLLQARQRDAAKAVLEAALMEMVGPEDARGLAWFVPTLEQGRDERRRPW